MLRRWLPDFNPGGGFYVENLIELLVLAAVVIPFLVLLLLLAVEWLLALVLVPLLALVRIVLPLAWTVVAHPTGRTADQERYAAEVCGWRTSRRVMREAADEIRRNGRPSQPPLIRHRFQG